MGLHVAVCTPYKCGSRRRVSLQDEVVKDSSWASRTLIERLRARPWGLAVATIVGDSTSVEVDAGDDEISALTTFEVGSITKTVTGVLLALAVGRDEVSLDSRLGQVFELDGNAADVTLRELATHGSGLPRLPPNLDVATVDPDDPYAGFDADDLLAGLRKAELTDRGTYAYSNFGFMALGLCLARRCGNDFSALCGSRLFDPLDL